MTRTGGWWIIPTWRSGTVPRLQEAEHGTRLTMRKGSISQYPISIIVKNRESGGVK